MANVNTGVFSCDFSGRPASGQFNVPRTSSRILFSADEPYNSPLSVMLSVMPGELLLIDAYQMPDDLRIFMNRLLIGDRGHRPQVVKPTLNSVEVRTAESLSLSGTLLYAKRMDINGAERWEISKENNIMCVTFPGTYQFELEDPDMVENIYVEFSYLSVPRDMAIPQDFWGGIR